MAAPPSPSRPALDFSGSFLLAASRSTSRVESISAQGPCGAAIDCVVRNSAGDTSNGVRSHPGSRPAVGLGHAGEFEHEIDGQTLPARLPGRQLVSCRFAASGLLADHGCEVFPSQARSPAKPAHGVRHLSQDLTRVQAPLKAEASRILRDSALLHQARHLTQDVAPGSALAAGFRFWPAAALQAIAGPLETVDADLDVRASLQRPASCLVAPAKGAVQLRKFHRKRLSRTFELGEKPGRAGVANADHAAQVVGTSHHGGVARIIAAEGAPITMVGSSQPMPSPRCHGTRPLKCGRCDGPFVRRNAQGGASTRFICEVWRCLRRRAGTPAAGQCGS